MYNQQICSFTSYLDEIRNNLKLNLEMKSYQFLISKRVALTFETLRKPIETL